MVDSVSKSVRLRELDVREQRRVALASVVRSALLVAVLLVLYSVWPFESAPDVSWDLGVLVLASVVFVWVLVRQGATSWTRGCRSCALWRRWW